MAKVAVLTMYQLKEKEDAMQETEVRAFMNALRYRMKPKPRAPHVPNAWLLIFGIAMMVAAVLLMVRFVYADEIDDIIPAIIQIESSGNPNAISHCGAVGLMQITPIVLQEFNLKTKHAYPLSMTDMLSPEWNKFVGTWYLRRLRDYYLKDIAIAYVCNRQTHIIRAYSACVEKNGVRNFGVVDNTDISWAELETSEEVELALVCAAYNGGITRLRKCKYDINCMPKETRNYVKKVMKLYKARQK